MSGGTFNYKQYAIKEIIEELERVLEEEGKPNPNYGRYVWEAELLRNDSENVQMIIREGIHALKRAHIFAQRIDWYLAGDDGEESLFKRLAEELGELENL
jgi:hypothetical protein